MKSLAHFLNNLTTSVKDPKILEKWIHYQWARATWGDPTLRIGSKVFAGFPDFNAYLGAWKYRPSVSEMLFLEHSLRAAITVLDVGANFGVLTALMCGVAQNAKLYAFEPHPKTFAALENNIVVNKLGDRVRCIQSAVGAFHGTVLLLETGAPATNRIGSDGECGIEVALTTIDGFCREHNLSSIDFLKVDVEGAELDVLRGAQGCFQKKLIRGGMIEICPRNLAQFGASVLDLKAFFRAHGYVLCWYGPQGEPAAAVPAELPADFLGNAAFMPHYKVTADISGKR